MSVKAKVEAIIYATEEPVSLNQLASLLKDAVLVELGNEEELRLALNDVIASEEPPISEETSVDDAVAGAPASSDSGSLAGNADSQPSPPEDLAQQQPHDTEKEETKRVKEYLTRVLEELTSEYNRDDHGVEVRQLAGGYRMGTKPEHHDVVVEFAKSLKPPVRLSLQALETLAVIAYKQPVTVPEISEIRGVDSSGVIGTLLDRKLINTAGRKQVIGRPILYKTTKEFLLRFGLNNVAELPSMDEFEKLGDAQAGLFPAGGDLAERAEPVPSEPGPLGSDVEPTGSGPEPEPTEAAATESSAGENNV
jgi:segregation and condensation protein B